MKNNFFKKLLSIILTAMLILATIPFSCISVLAEEAGVPVLYASQISNNTHLTATEKGSKHEECVVCGYARPAVEIPATGSAPETGDNRNMFLWIALLSVSGFGIVTTAVYGKKRKSVK